MRVVVGVQWAWIAQSVLRLATGWNIRGSNLGEQEAFPYASRPALDPQSFEYYGYRVCFPPPPSGETRTLHISPFCALMACTRVTITFTWMQCECLESNLNESLFRRNGKFVFFSKSNSLRHILCSNILHGPLSWHRISLWPPLSARVCVGVCVCVSVSVTSFGRRAGPRHRGAPLQWYFLNYSCYMWSDEHF